MPLYISSEIPKFNFEVFDFSNNSAQVIEVSDDLYNNLLKIMTSGNKVGLCEEATKLYFMNLGWSVIDDYILRGSSEKLDLTINKNGIVKQIECKSYNDKLSKKQLNLLFKKKGMIFWMVKK